MDFVIEALQNPAVQAALVAAGTSVIVVVGDYAVKRSKNKLDDAIWAVIKRRILRRAKK